MAWLTSLSATVLVVASLVVALGVAAGARAAVHGLVPVAERDHVQTIAGPLMPALGATFAVLMALTLSSEAAYLRNAQDIVSNEAAAASRLAWAATSPRVNTAAIHDALNQYLRAIRAKEWAGATESEGRAEMGSSIARLERIVRAEAARPALGSPTSTELLASLDALTSARRARTAAASRQIPGLYVVTLLASGIALVINGGALVFRSAARTSMLVSGLAVVVGLSFALLFALSAPWKGPLVVSGGPVDAVVQDLHAGFFAGGRP